MGMLAPSILFKTFSSVALRWFMKKLSAVLPLLYLASIFFNFSFIPRYEMIKIYDMLAQNGQKYINNLIQIIQYF